MHEERFDNCPALNVIIDFLTPPDVANLKLCSRALQTRILREHGFTRHAHAIWVSNPPTLAYTIRRFISSFNDGNLKRIRIYIWRGTSVILMICYFTFMWWLVFLHNVFKNKWEAFGRIGMVFTIFAFDLFEPIGTLEQIHIPPLANPEYLMTYCREDDFEDDLLQGTGGPFCQTNIVHNFLYLISGGFIFPILHTITAVVQVVTIIGILNVMHHLRLARALLWPIGYDFKLPKPHVLPLDPRRQPSVLERMRNYRPRGAAPRSNPGPHNV